MRVITALLLIAVAAPALATEPSYNFLTATYQKVDLDNIVPGVNVDGNAISFGGSFELNDSFHVFAGFGNADFDFGVDLDELLIGVGYQAELNPSSDLIFSLAYIDAEASAQGLSIDDDGFGASVGVRTYFTDELELAGSLDYVNFDAGDDDTSLNGAIRYHFAPNLAVEANLGLADETVAYGVGVRWYFSQ